MSIITDFVKEKLGIEKDILIERALRTGKTQRNDGARNRKSNLCEISQIQRQIRNSVYLQRKEAVEEKSPCRRGFFWRRQQSFVRACYRK